MPRITFDTIKLKLKALKDKFFRKKTLPIKGPERFYISPKKRILTAPTKREPYLPIISTAFYGKAVYRLWMRQAMKAKKKRRIIYI